MRKKASHEGSVTQRKDGLWQVSLMVNGTRTVKYAKTEREGYNKLNEIKKERLLYGQLPNGGKRTVNDLLDLWLETVKPTLKPLTVADYEAKINKHVRPVLGKVKVTSLNGNHLQSLYSNLQGQGRTRLPHLIHALLRRALKFAVMWGWANSNPAERVFAPKYQAGRREVWSIEELQVFLENTRNERLHPVWLLLVTTGCRIGELLGLKWSDIDWQNGAVEIKRNLQRVRGVVIESTPKTKAGQRLIALPLEAMVALRKQRAQQAEYRLHSGEEWGDQGFVFTTEKGEPLNRSTIERSLSRRCARLRIRRITPHDLRHLHASLLLSKRLPVPAVSSRLGHANPSITASIYAHALRCQDDEAAQAMSDILQKAEAVDKAERGG